MAFRFRVMTRAGGVRVAIFFGLTALLLGWSWWTMIRMPGRSHAATLPALTAHETELRDRLTADVKHLAGEIGERNMLNMEAYRKASDWIEASLGDAGYPVKRETYMLGRDELRNVVAEIPGTSRKSEVVVIGAHYDSVMGTPGANDNGSGTVAVLALARAFAGKKPARTLRFVLFANEEPPYFQDHDMGSLVYAKGCRARNEDVVAMFSLETMGAYYDAPKSQHYPRPFNLLYPSVGNFIAFVGNYGSRSLTRRAVGTFRAHATLPSEGAAVPDFFPGVGWSDHWSFWQVGYPGVMVTDTAVFRYVPYHTNEDTPEKLDYDRFARAVVGMEPVIAELGEVP
jgi:hypothetical protein